MQELELAKALLEELKHIEELQQNVKESESDDITYSGSVVKTQI